MLISCPNHEWGENYSDWVKTGNGYESVGASKSTITKKTTHIEDEQPYDAVDGANHAGYFYDIYVYVYGDTPSTAPAIIQCN